MGGEEDAASREHSLLICPTTFVPLRRGNEFVGERERKCKVKALDFSYVLFGISCAWADTRERISRRDATRCKYRKCGVAIYKLHHSDLHRLVLKVILDNAQRINPQVPLAELTHELNGI
jgi:hypothetical protein